MSDSRYRYSGRRSPTYNPARASLPVGIGHDPHHSGDIRTTYTGRYDTRVPRGNDQRLPLTTVTTYNVSKEPPARSASVRDNRSHHRSSTFDVAPVKPIIVTTNHGSNRPHHSASHSVNERGHASPTREAYRPDEETYYTQPATSMPARTRSHNRHRYSANLDSDESYRLRDRVGTNERLRAPYYNDRVEAYRPSSRQATYINPPRGGSSAIDLGGDDYEYTGPGDLARYDIEHGRPRDRGSRHDSFDRYYRPTVSLVSSDEGRPVRRESRRGPPPTSAALDRYNRAATADSYDRPSVMVPAPPPAVPPSPTTRRAGHLEPPLSPSHERRSSRPRPISLYQEATPRMSHPDDIYRAHDDERGYRDRRGREEDWYRDEPVTSRGAGHRPEIVDPPEHYRSVEPERRDYEELGDEYRPRREVDDRESRRRSDDELDRKRAHDQRSVEARDRPTRLDDGRDRADGRERKRDKIATGIEAAAAAIGLGPILKAEDDKDKKEAPRRRRGSDGDMDRREIPAAERYKPRDEEVDRKHLPPEEPAIVEPKHASTKERIEPREEPFPREKEGERSRREPEAGVDRPKEDTRNTNLLSPDGATPRRRPRAHSAFDPTDTRGLMELKAELAAREAEDDKPKDKGKAVAKVIELDKETVASSGSSNKAGPSTLERDEVRGREIVSDPEQKQVRLVSPPRDKGEQKPLKGILKQPKEQFPEDPNPVREGVAPHKDDKSKKDLPPDARWTKVKRSLISPRALEAGKERFEARDDFVIVLRVLSKEEIEEYAIASAQIRERDSKEAAKYRGYESRDRDRDVDREQDRELIRDEDERRRRERHRRERERERERERAEEEEPRRQRDRDRDRERERERDRDRDTEAEYEREKDRDRDRHSRRYKYEDVEEGRPRALEYYDSGSHHHSHRPHRERERERESVAVGADERR